MTRSKSKSKSKVATAAAVEPQKPAQESRKTLASVPGFFGACVAPNQHLVWDNDVEEFVLNLNAAALGAEVQLGRSTLFVVAKDQKTALCSLTPQTNEQWNLTQTFTSLDGPVVFTCEGVNAIHLTGFVDIQDEPEDDDDDEEDYEGCCDDEECDGCEVDDDGEPLYVHGHDHDDHDEDSDEVDEDTLMFGVDSDSDSEDDDDDDEEEEEDVRFEVLEERVHGDVDEHTPKKEQATKTLTPKDTKKTDEKTTNKTPTPDKQADKKHSIPVKKNEPKSPQKKTPVKQEVAGSATKKSPAAAAVKKEQQEASTPATKTAKSPAKLTTPAAKESVKKQQDASKTSTPTTSTPATASGKKRALAPESVDVPKKAKTSKVIKGVNVVEHSVGKGAPVQRGKKVSILYRGRLENGKQFDAAQNRKRPFTFRHGIGDVIKGMDFGIEGMRAGGKRTITIPSHLGYGRSGAPPTIPGNATLIFDIEML